MSERYLEINQNHKVMNIILWNGTDPYEQPEGWYLLRFEDFPQLRVGWEKINGEWVNVPALEREQSEEA